MPCQLYRNDGGDTFTPVTSGAFVTDALSNYGASAGDFDRDGDLDLFAPTARSEAASVLYRNDTANGNHWLEVIPRGTGSNRTGLGAKVRVVTGVGNSPLRQMREIAACSGYGGHNAAEAHFGLADAAVVDSLVLEWPSGARQVIASVAANQVLSVSEDITTAGSASPFVAHATAEYVTVTWELGAASVSAWDVERASGGGAWLALGTATLEGTRRASYTDHAPLLDARSRYRLTTEEAGRRVSLGEIEVTVSSKQAWSLGVRGGGTSSRCPRPRWSPLPLSMRRAAVARTSGRIASAVDGTRSRWTRPAPCRTACTGSGCVRAT